MTATYKFSWLHFTDLHVGMAGASYLYPNVEEILFDDLAKQHKKSGPWDAIFFTGDLAQKGLAEEFEEFDRKIGNLLAHLKALGSNPVLLAIPGNHDLVRPDPDGALIAALSSWSVNARIRDTFWTKDDSEYRQGVNVAFSNWTKWSQHGINVDRLVNYRQGLLPGDFSATLEFDGISIGVLGLNTTALQLSAGDYKGKLSLHPKQLEPLFPDRGLPAWARAHHACFLLTHHPIEWLDNDGKDAIRGEIALPGRFALHLCGHLHEATYTQISEGGAKSRLTLQGRSLFGMETYDDGQIERLHGYSAGTIEFENSRFLCLWPRASFRQQAGDLKIIPDHSMDVNDHGLLEPRDIGPAPSPLPDEEAVATLAPISNETILEGWREITPEFLESRRRELSNEELTLFFNGQEPSWEHALVQRSVIPHRNIVEKTVTALLDAGTPLFVRLFGAGGEGKSISLLQIASTLALEGWNILFHEDDGGLFSHQILNIPTTGRWALVSDNAEQIVPNILEAVMFARRNGRNNIHWVLAARDTDWTAAWRKKSSQNEPNWSLYAREWPPKDERSAFFSMSRDEAERVIVAWEKAGCLGELAGLANEKRAERLWSAATGTSSVADKTFFGGILDTRFSAEGLVDHVGKLMQRLRGDDKKIGDRGYTLYDAFLCAAAMDAIDIEGVDLHVIADLVGVERRYSRTQILMPLGFEAAGTGSGSALRTRHPAIARATITLAESEFQTDLEELYKDIVGGSMQAYLEKRHIPNYGSVINSGNILSRKLKELKIERERADQIAIAVAEEVEKIEPDKIANTTSLSKTYREAGRYEEAKNALRRSLPRFFSCKDWSEKGRAFILELSVAEGKTNTIQGIYSVSLSGLAAADIERLNEKVTIDHAKLCLASVGVGCRKMKGLARNSVYAKGLRAVAVLGATIRSDQKRYYLQDAQRADELGVEKCDFDTAFIWLENAIKEAYLAINDDELITFINQLGIANAESIRFRTLKRLLSGRG